ncbi:hypothetical protein [Nocardioides sp. WS12]|uniref:hypothetical protein n=1 Tax=Nocardioides sp. WS12 TaxID=2486272 RepID=UPI0015F7D577|nr:hypothetical protein [Nocardioides sp. WS12]
MAQAEKIEMRFKFVWSPDGVEPKTWNVNATRLPSPECEEIERRTDWAFATEFLPQLGKVSHRAIHALLYVLLRRETPGLDYDAVTFDLADISLEDVDDPKAEALSKSGD